MGTKYRTCLVAEVLILALSCTTLAESETEELGVKIERNVPVPMRDGTILRADVHRPDHGGPYPVLVQRTPYGKDRRNFDRFVKAGYIIVCQDVRGRYESEGKFESLWRFNTHDAEDGYDTIEWSAKVPGSTGKVGTFGTSYNAFLQWRLAPLRPPSLKCMSAYRGGAASLTDAEGPAGIRPGIEPQWWPRMAADMRRRENMPGVHTVWEAQKLWEEDSEKWIYWLPWLELPGDFFGYETDAAKHWLKNPHVDPWKLDEGIKEITVPNLDITGWYDHALGDMLLFRTMAKKAKIELARKGSRVIIGPWSHARPARYIGNIDFGPDALLDRTAMQIRWFDYWLKGKQNGAEKDAPVRIFVMGDNQWRDEQHWPLRRTEKRILFITSDGHANTPRGDGKLVIERPESSNTDKYVYDPKDPVPTPYGTQKADQRSLANRQDILVYLTEPLAERLEVTGNPVVELYAASSAPDTDWFVRLIDVAPDGLARDASSGMVRARYRKGLDRPKLIKPGEVVKYTIRMSPTSNAFLPGHRIRLDITSSDFPWYDRNHNTAANQNADATLVTAKQTIYHGGEQATRIILPWVPNPIEEEKPTEEKKHEPEAKKQMYPLHQAAAEGKIEQVKLLISEGADVNEKTTTGDTPLHYAVRYGHEDVAKLLIAKGAHVNERDAEGDTPLHYAAKYGHKNVAVLLIEKGADVNAKNKNGDLPTHLALRGHLESPKKEVLDLLIAKGPKLSCIQISAYQGDLAEVRSFVEKGIDVDSRDSEGRTALYYAAIQGKRDVVEFLLSRGANVNAKDKDVGFMPLHHAVGGGHKDVVELLIAKGADVNAKDKYGWTPLDSSVYGGNTDIPELLIEAGANVNSRYGWGQTPLIWAAQEGHRPVVQLLIVKGADVNAQDGQGLTPLHYAADEGHKDVAELLIAKGADVNAGEGEWTALHGAVSEGRRDIAELLIQKGADVNTKDKTGYQLLSHALWKKDLDTAKLLITKGADVNAGEGKWTALHYAVYEGCRDIAELLIQKGANVNTKDKTGYQPLYYALWKKDLDTAKLLITKGADVNAKDNDGMPLLHYALSMDSNDVAKLLLAEGADFAWKDKSGLTALHYAAVNEYQDIANLLLTKGVKVDERDDVYEFTALHYSARFGSKNVAEILIANGADINAKDKWDYQPIHWAAYHDRADVVELLISKGADINAKTSLGQTPLQLAKIRRNTETIEVLRKYEAKE